MNKFQYNSRNPLGGIFSIAFLVVLVIGLFYVFSAFTKFLYWASPILIIAALLIRHKVVVNYVKQITNLVKKAPMLGIAAIVFTFLLYPFVSLHLFLKSLRKPRPKATPENPFFFGPPQEEPPTEFTDFEDLSEKESPKEDDPYDEFFEI